MTIVASGVRAAETWREGSVERRATARRGRSPLSSLRSPFLRPDDLRLVRRNRRQVQAERILGIAGRVLFGFLLVVMAYWIYQRTQQDARFAVRTVELTGAKHTPRAELDRVTRAYVGLNLFKLDIERVQRDLRYLPWVERVSIEKQLPSTLRIALVERRPVALAVVDGTLRYVDAGGRAFAELSPQVGNPDLPLITNARATQIADCVRLLSTLQQRHGALFDRVSEISPAGESGFAIFDRDLRTNIYLSGEEDVDKWMTVYGIARAENFSRKPAEYVDLRFANRIIVKPTPSMQNEEIR